MDHTTKAISFIIAATFCIYLIHSFFAGKNGTAKKVISIDDNYRLGYIQRQPTKIVIEQPKVSLNQECVKIMKAIGYSEESAKSIVRDFFKNDTAKDLEEFFVKINI